MRKLASLGVLLVLLSVAGCKKTKVGEAANEEAAQTQQIAQTLQATSQKVDQLGSAMAGLSSATAAQNARPDFAEDLAAAKRLTAQLSVQASKQQDAEASPTLARLTRCLATLVGEAPASRIQTTLERALVHLTAGDLAKASAQVLAAAGAAYNPSAPALVPDVLTQLQDASAALSAGDANKATTAINAIIDKTSQDVTAGDLLSAQTTALAARDPLRMKAWPILIAQTTYLSDLLAGVEKRSQPQATPEKPAASSPAPTPPPAGAEAEPAAAAQPAAPAAVTQPSAAGADQAAKPPAGAPAATKPAPPQTKSP